MAAPPVKTWSTPVSAEEKKLIPCAVCGGQRFSPSLSCEGFSYVRCDVCRLVQMNPQPLPSEIRKRYNKMRDASASGDLHAGTAFGDLHAGVVSGDLHAGDYLAYELANEEAFLNLQLLALADAGFNELEGELLPGTKQPLGVNGKASCNKPRVLDIGCATGSLLERLKGRGWETTGIEISAAQAEYGRQKRGLDVRDLPLEENLFPAESFDVVLASHLIEHVNDPAALVHEVHRILAPGGRFFVTTPNIAGFQAKLFGSRWRSAIFDHLYLFSATTLSRLLRQQGFVIEKIATWGGLAAGTAPLPVKRLFDKAAKRFGWGDVMIVRARPKALDDSGIPAA